MSVSCVKNHGVNAARLVPPRGSASTSRAAGPIRATTCARSHLPNVMVIEKSSASRKKLRASIATFLHNMVKNIQVMETNLDHIYDYSWWLVTDFKQNLSDELE